MSKQRVLSLVEQPPSMLVEVFAENAVPSSHRFFLGERVERITLGTQGDWRITAPGVADFHAAIHFDGEDLFLIEAPDCAVFVDGQRAARDWQRLTPPATIELGAARLDVYEFEQPVVTDARAHDSLAAGSTLRPTTVSTPNRAPDLHVSSSASAENLRKHAQIWTQLAFALSPLVAFAALGLGLAAISSPPNVTRVQAPIAAAAPAQREVARPASEADVPATPVFVVMMDPIADNHTTADRQTPRTELAPVSSQERRAVNALLSGDRREAFRIYNKLAKAHPTIVPYRDAVRVLSPRTKRNMPAAQKTKATVQRTRTPTRGSGLPKVAPG